MKLLNDSLINNKSLQKCCGIKETGIFSPNNDLLVTVTEESWDGSTNLKSVPSHFSLIPKVTVEYKIDCIINISLK